MLEQKTASMAALLCVSLLLPIYDSSLSQIVNGQLHDHRISDKKSDRMDPQFAGRFCGHDRTVFKFDGECVTDRVDDNTFNLYTVILSHL